MKILIYDNNRKDLEKLCNMLKYLPDAADIDKVSEHQDFEEFYIKYSYDIVFIDLNDEFGFELYAFVMNRNPNQKLITINNNIRCYDDNGCEHCKTTYKKSRLLKPIHIEDLLYVLKNDYCNYDYCNDSLTSKIKILSNVFKTLHFNEETLKVYNANKCDQFNVYDLIGFTSKLTSNNIKFLICDNYIQILDD